MKVANFKLLVLIAVFFSVFVSACNSAQAESEIKITVEVVKASRTSTIVDPELKDLSKELGMLNFKGFVLFKKATLRLGKGKEGEVSVGGNRVVVIGFQGLDESSRARVRVRILENNHETFQTTLLMSSGGKALIGGPPIEDGNLLLRIKGEF